MELIFKQKEGHVNLNVTDYVRLPGFCLPSSHRNKAEVEDVDYGKEKESPDTEESRDQTIRKLQKAVRWMVGLTITLFVEVIALYFFFLRDIEERFNQTDQQINGILQEVGKSSKSQDDEHGEWYVPNRSSPHEYSEPEAIKDYVSI